MPKLLYFIDLDGVVVNLMDGVKKEFTRLGISFNPDAKEFEELGVHIGITMKLISEMTPEWWAALDPFPDAVEFFLDRRWKGSYILSSHGHFSGAATGKLLWVEKHLPSFRRNVVLAVDKYLLAAPGRVLIDDTPKKLKKWSEYGGESRLWTGVDDYRREWETG